uniref:Uncharacterized protein n=1 Tax=Arundo donax TaxID=35708 RepID=A0A0A9FZV2_ARUDO
MNLRTKSIFQCICQREACNVQWHGMCNSYLRHEHINSILDNLSASFCGMCCKK